MMHRTLSLKDSALLACSSRCMYTRYHAKALGVLAINAQLKYVYSTGMGTPNRAARAFIFSSSAGADPAAFLATGAPSTGLPKRLARASALSDSLVIPKRSARACQYRTAV